MRYEQIQHSQKWLSKRWALAVALTVIIAVLLLAGCATGQGPQISDKGNNPARIEPIQGSALSRVILTDSAVTRLDIQTTLVKKQQVHGKQQTVVPYSALFYDQHGATWVYTNPEHNTYQRAPISVDFIEGDLVVLSKGPYDGTVIVTVGAPEIYGAESGIGAE